MKVTNTIEQIGKCRDLLLSKDFNLILRYLILFEQVCDTCKRHVDKYIKNPKYELDFNCYDLQELSDEIYEYVKKFQKNFTFDYGYKKLAKYKIIDNDVLKKFTQESCNEMFLDRKLREAYKILAYLGLTLYLWQRSRGEE
jgi:hypothetical protein